MVLFKKKKKAQRPTLVGFLKKKFVGDLDLDDARSRTKSYFSRKIDDIKQYLTTLRVKLKDIPGTNYQLGLYHMKRGNFTDAILRFRMVCRFAPKNIDAFYNLARCLMFKGANKDAKKRLQHVLSKEPNHLEAQYLLKKIDSPTTIDSVPRSIIKETIDIRASYYKEDYLDNGYSGSKALVGEMFKNIDDVNPNYDVLDLGCGMGVCGSIIKKRSLARNIVGVDLSDMMVDRCRRYKIDDEDVYDEVHQDEISEYLKKEQSKYDVVLSDLATDFIGKLDGYALSIKNVLKEGRYYAAIIRMEEDLESGFRHNSDFEDFTHSKKYFVDSFERIGFKLRGEKKVDILGEEKGLMLIFQS